MDQTEVLPDDALANILGRLPPRDLAASRCVRKAWRTIVDAHGMLLPHVLPHMVRGIFFSRKGQVRRISFFARPWPSADQPMIDGELDFVPRYGGMSKLFVDHCNGLLLYRDFKTLCVVNPITRRWDEIPWEEECYAYLTFDPAVSLHYEVFSIPSELENVVVNPPSLWTLNVFTSGTEQWNKRSFVREAVATDTLSNVRLDPVDPKYMCWRGTSSSVYWRGSLYVNFRGLFVVRLSLSDGKYRVIETPIDIDEDKRARPYVGKSEYGVYFATIHGTCRLQVWILMESSEQIDWVLKHHIDLNPCADSANSWLRDLLGFDKTWILDGDDNDRDGNNGMPMAENLDWDSDDDNVLNIQDNDYQCPYNYVCFHGFHPYKEVVFLELPTSSGGVGVAYHLNSSKIQYLGRLHPKGYSGGIYQTFPYTPCLIGYLKHFRGC